MGEFFDVSFVEHKVTQLLSLHCLARNLGSHRIVLLWLWATRWNLFLP